jgi:hypothetical protein
MVPVYSTMETMIMCLLTMSRHQVHVVQEIGLGQDDVLVRCIIENDLTLTKRSSGVSVMESRDAESDCWQGGRVFQFVGEYMYVPCRHFSAFQKKRMVRLQWVYFSAANIHNRYLDRDQRRRCSRLLSRRRWPSRSLSWRFERSRS